MLSLYILINRCFLRGHILVRQKTLYNIVTGDCLGKLDDYIQSAGFLPCDLTPNGRFILIAAGSDLNQYEMDTKKVRMKFESKNVPHSFAITPDSKYCYVGYNVDCLFKMFDIDPDSHEFGKTIYTFDYAQYFKEKRSGDTFNRFATTRYSNELTSIAISPRHQNMVLINIRGGLLILLDVDKREPKKLDMSQVTVDSKRGIRHSSFSSDGKYLIAAGAYFISIFFSK